jgi:hypothetical protein
MVDGLTDYFHTVSQTAVQVFFFVRESTCVGITQEKSVGICYKKEYTYFSNSLYHILQPALANIQLFEIITNQTKHKKFTD